MPTDILRAQALVVAGVLSLVRGDQDRDGPVKGVRRGRVALVRRDPVRGVLPPDRRDRQVPEARVLREPIRHPVLSKQVSKVLQHPIRQNPVVQEGRVVRVRKVLQVVRAHARVDLQVHAAQPNPEHPQRLAQEVLVRVPQAKHQVSLVRDQEGMTGSRVVRLHMNRNLALRSPREEGVNALFEYVLSAKWLAGQDFFGHPVL